MKSINQKDFIDLSLYAIWHAGKNHMATVNGEKAF